MVDIDRVQSDVSLPIKSCWANFCEPKSSLMWRFLQIFSRQCIPSNGQRETIQSYSVCPHYSLIGWELGADSHLKKASMVFAGTVLGQLVFGYLVDRYGRRPGIFLHLSRTVDSSDDHLLPCLLIVGMVFASLWLTLFSVISGLAYGGGGSIQGLFTALIAYRFLLGIGIGAEVCRNLRRRSCIFSVPN